jgi:hypothetical protein
MLSFQQLLHQAGHNGMRVPVPDSHGCIPIIVDIAKLCRNGSEDVVALEMRIACVTHWTSGFYSRPRRNNGDQRRGVTGVPWSNQSSSSPSRTAAYEPS